MASTDFNAEVLEGTQFTSLPAEGTPDAIPGDLGSNLFGSGALNYFKMRGMDQVTAGLYATWVVFGTPDFTAIYYVGGLNLPLRDVTIDASWSA